MQAEGAQEPGQDRLVLIGRIISIVDGKRKVKCLDNVCGTCCNCTELYRSTAAFEIKGNLTKDEGNGKHGTFWRGIAARQIIQLLVNSLEGQINSHLP